MTNHQHHTNHSPQQPDEMSRIESIVIKDPAAVDFSSVFRHSGLDKGCLDNQQVISKKKSKSWWGRFKNMVSNEARVLWSKLDGLTLFFITSATLISDMIIKMLDPGVAGGLSQISILLLVVITTLVWAKQDEHRKKQAKIDIKLDNILFRATGVFLAWALAVMISPFILNYNGGRASYNSFLLYSSYFNQERVDPEYNSSLSCEIREERVKSFALSATQPGNDAASNISHLLARGVSNRLLEHGCWSVGEYVDFAITLQQSHQESRQNPNYVLRLHERVGWLSDFSAIDYIEMDEDAVQRMSINTPDFCKTIVFSSRAEELIGLMDEPYIQREVSDRVSESCEIFHQNQQQVEWSSATADQYMLQINQILDEKLQPIRDSE